MGATVIGLLVPAAGYRCACCQDPQPETLFLTSSEGTIPIVYGAAPPEYFMGTVWYGKQTVTRPRYTGGYKNFLKNWCEACGELEEGPVEIEWTWPFSSGGSGGVCGASALFRGVQYLLEPNQSIPCTAFYAGPWPPIPCQEPSPRCDNNTHSPGVGAWYGLGPNSCGPPMALVPNGAFVEHTPYPPCPALEINLGPVLVQE